MAIVDLGRRRRVKCFCWGTIVSMSAQQKHGLSRPEIYSVVNDYIGVEGGYLSDFTYRSHAEFYPYYCDLDINPLELDGMTTRERFVHILERAKPSEQAKILRGVLRKCPPADDAERRTHARASSIQRLIAKLETGAGVSSPTPHITSEVVERAIIDAETLIAKNGATSGVDRVHTALHGYLKAACDGSRLGYTKDPGLTDLFKVIREHHPRFQIQGPRGGDIEQVLRAIGAILAALNPVRNRASVAHPNDSLLDEPEAMLVINAARTILHYLDAKMK
jgi:hypothetical protein